MIEYINFLFESSNLIATVLFLFVVMYWLTVIIGALDLEFLDFDVDVHADVDVDAHIDIHADATIDHGGSVLWFNHVLAFFNLGRVPFMVFLTFWFIPIWIITVSTNEFLGFVSFIPGLLVFLVAAFLSLFIAKFATWPFVKVFAYMEKEDQSAERPIGRVGIALTTVEDGRIGQGEIKIDSNTVRILMRTSEGTELPRGEQFLVIEYKEEEKVYLVEPYRTID